MPGDECIERPLFGGAISSCFPLRFQDVSDVREVPDHQEVFADPDRDESLIFELLDLKPDVEDNNSALWFLRDIASEQNAEESMVLEHLGTLEAGGLCRGDTPVIVTTAIAQMAISKSRQGKEAQNIVRIYLANLRLKEVGTDVLITVNEPILINPLSESTRTVAAGVTVPAALAGLVPASEIFKLAVTSFKVHDWNLFGSGSGEN